MSAARLIKRTTDSDRSRREVPKHTYARPRLQSMGRVESTMSYTVGHTLAMQPDSRRPTFDATRACLVRTADSNRARLLLSEYALDAYGLHPVVRGHVVKSLSQAHRGPPSSCKQHVLLFENSPNASFVDPSAQGWFNFISKKG